ncbi:hypothetical protein J4217_04650 [Candidatus Pacearchaeota archaeon]|nr:hypothetical protein [Candidatus Pacearchaeota archaeon]
MAKTIKSIIMNIVNGKNDFVSRGELYVKAQRIGYNGTQERLLGKANHMIGEGLLFGRKRGMAQLLEYRALEAVA